MRTYRGPGGDERVWYEDREIEQITESELRKARLLPTPSTLPVDIEKLIERHLGVTLDQHAELAPDILGETHFFIGAPPKISINRILTGSALDDEEGAPGVLGRWRATLAHEASHVLLHRFLFDCASNTLDLFDGGGLGLPRTKRLHRCLKRDASYRRVSDWREVQANKGMAALLMPRALFAQVARNELETAHLSARRIPADAEAALVAKLASRFAVSRQAARIRLETFGILSPPAQTQM